MKPMLAACLVMLLLPTGVRAADDAGALFDKGLEELVRNGYTGDISGAQRYLAAVLEQQPDHLQARWLMLYVAILPLKDVPLSERTEALAGLSPEFGRLEKLARASKQEAFLHYMTAIHAGFYSDYERALPEIEKAVALEPRSARYLAMRGRLLAESGKWTENDSEVEAGIKVLQEARELLGREPSPFLADRDFDFYLAVALSSLAKPRWPEVIDHYQRAVAATEPSLRQAFAWNNSSMAYRKSGDCARAKEAAEKALAIADFGVAHQNKRRAEFCLAMQELGVTPPAGSPAAASNTTSPAK